MYPVEVAYLQEPTEDYVAEAVRVIWGLHMQVRSVLPNPKLCCLRRELFSSQDMVIFWYF